MGEFSRIQRGETWLSALTSLFAFNYDYDPAKEAIDPIDRGTGRHAYLSALGGWMPARRMLGQAEACPKSLAASRHKK